MTFEKRNITELHIDETDSSADVISFWTLDIVAALVAQHCPLSAIYAAIVAMDALLPNPELEPDDFIVFSSSRTWSSKSCICWVCRSVRKAPSVPMTPRTPIPTKA